MLNQGCTLSEQMVAPLIRTDAAWSSAPRPPGTAGRAGPGSQFMSQLLPVPRPPARRPGRDRRGAEESLQGAAARVTDRRFRPRLQERHQVCCSRRDGRRRPQQASAQEHLRRRGSSGIVCGPHCYQCFEHHLNHENEAPDASCSRSPTGVLSGPVLGFI